MRAIYGPPLRRIEPQIRYDPHPVRSFTLRPSQSAFSLGAAAHVDENGFRATPGRDRAQPDAIVFALGDSFTFGMGVDDEETWPAILQQWLDTRHSHVRVINGGTISYGVFQEMNLLQEHAPDIHPDVVIHALYWNDYQSAHPPNPKTPSVLRPNGLFVWEPDEAPGFSIRRFFAEHSMIATAVWNSFSRLDRDASEISDPRSYGAAYRKLVSGDLASETWRPVAEFYDQLVPVGNSLGFTTFVVIMPVVDIVSQPDPTNHPYPRLMRQLLEERHISYLDCFAVWQRSHAGTGLFLPQGPDAHLDATGYHLLVEALENALLADRVVASHLHL